MTCLRSTFRHTAAAALILGGLGQAGHAAPREVASIAAQSPFIGEWELDLTRMPDTYGPPPKQVTFTFDDMGSGPWRTTIEITAPNGSVRRSASVYRRDGKAVQTQGDTAEADSAAFSSPAPNVLVMNLSKDDRPAGVRVYTISADGKEMTESAAGADGEGAPFVRTFHFKRIR